MRVVKRDGTEESFDISKIEHVVKRCLKETGKMEDLNNVVDAILSYAKKDIIKTEELNDIVESVLFEMGLTCEYKNFILHRENNKKVRSMSVDNSAMSSYIFKNRYAVYNESLKRRETWDEAVNRVRDMHIRKYTNMRTELIWAFEQVRRKRVLPSMRSMQFAGEPIERNHARLYNCSYAVADGMTFFSEAIYLLLCGCGVGFSVEWEHVNKIPKIIEPDMKIIKHVGIQDSIEGWADAVYELMVSYQAGYTVEFNYSLIRTQGSRISSGGKAPGHVPLRRALENMRKILDGAVGRKLKPIEAYDIVMHSAEAVLAGGVRRSACICLFSKDDEEMANAKTGDWLKTNKQRTKSNNSVKLLRNSTTKEEFSRIFAKQKEWGEPAFYFVDDLDHGTNPCFHSSTKILTKDGWIAIGELYNNGTENLVAVDNRVGKGDEYNKNAFGIKYNKATKVHLTQKQAELYKVVTDNGNEIIATPNHNFITTEGRKRLDELELGDVLPIMSSKCSFGNNGSYKEGLALGLFSGDGCVSMHHGKKVAYIDYWNKDGIDAEEKVVLDLIEEFVEEVCSKLNKTNRKYTCKWHKQIAKNGYNKIRIGGERLYKYLMTIGATSKHDVISYIMKGNEALVRGYIQGLFLADGTVLCSGENKSTTVSVRLTQNNDDFLKDVQILLNSFGVVSKLYSRRKEGFYNLPDGHGNSKSYLCKQIFELIISRPNTIVMEMENLLIGEKRVKLEESLNYRGRDCRKPEHYKTKVISIEYYGVDDVYCLTENQTNSVIANGIAIGQCVEIGLYPFIEQNGEKKSGFAFCNLTTMNGRLIKSEEDFRIAVMASAIIGTCQAGYTDFKYLSKVTTEIAKREALLGMSITGIMDNPKVILDEGIQSRMAELAIAENKRIAEKIGINQASRVTCVKPEGSTSILLDTASGIHPRYAQKYFRRIQANINDPVYKHFKEQNPHCCEPLQTSVNKTDDVITFCCKSPEGAICKDDLSAIEFLEIIRKTQENWVMKGTALPDRAPGLNHNVSNTIPVKDHEWDLVEEYIYENRAMFTGISMMPDGGRISYPQSPFQQVYDKDDELMWEDYNSKYEKVDYVSLKEMEDNTTLKDVVACGGNQCEIT